MDKHYITPQQLLEDAFNLAWQVFTSGFAPDYVVGVWRGGTPVAIAVQELLFILGINADHFAIRTRSYTGIAQREQQVQTDGLDYLCERITSNNALLLVDDIYDTGLSLQAVVDELQQRCAAMTPDIRIATPYFNPGNNRTDRIPDFFLHRTDHWLVFPHELEGLTLAEMRANKPELAALVDKLEGRLK